MSFSVFPLPERGAREASTIKMKQARAQCHKTFTGVISNAEQKLLASLVGIYALFTQEPGLFCFDIGALGH
jgi:hypothetical protein